MESIRLKFLLDVSSSLNRIIAGILKFDLLLIIRLQEVEKESNGKLFDCLDVKSKWNPRGIHETSVS